MENLSGQSIQGYDLLERIGSGGFGAVYRAYQSTVGREVAVKVILPAFANKAEFIRRFEIEAQLIARLEHLHIVPLYDFWRDQQGAYLVMRWLRGGNLSDALRAGPFQLRSASLLLDHVAAGLTAAHSQQVIHRDLKPSNILLDEEGNAYLGDFGIAWDLRQSDGNGAGKGNQLPLQADGGTEANGRFRIAGSIAYLAPERLRGEEAAPQSDIYSLGITLYEVVTGHHPFPGLTSIQQLFNQINEPMPRIDTLDTAVADDVNEVLRKATAKNPRHRYQDALALARAFREAARIGQDGQTAELVESLTRREQEILHMIAVGMTNKQIAQELVVEISTIKWHITQIYKKLGVRSRVQATVRARDLDLIISTEEIEHGLPEASSASVILAEPANPYKGLNAFKPADNRDFFGREGLVEKLLARFAQPLSPRGDKADGENRFLAVVGPSGSGKSSLIQAGLVPALWSGRLPGSEKWFIVTMVPGERPLDELEISLMRIAADQAGNLRGLLDRDAHGLLRAAGLILPNDDTELVIIIDQFEELFTLADDEKARSHFLDLIQAAVVDSRSRVRVVIGLRADFYDRPLQYSAFGELVQKGVEILLPLTAKELERAIVRPAERAGLAFEEGLVASIIEEVSYRPGSLPLLQFALAELFEQRQGRLLTHEAYAEIGGASGALAGRAEELYQEYSEGEQEAIHQMFLRLVSVGDNGLPESAVQPPLNQQQRPSDTRRRVLRSELLAAANNPDRLDEIIDTYADYRLLSLDHHPATRQPLVEVAHEAILREWDRLRGWVEESQAELVFHRQLARSAAEWAEAERDWSFLLRGNRLTQFEAWAKNTRIALTGQELAFLEASLANREERASQERERQKHSDSLERSASQRLKALVVVMALALVISVGLAIAAVSFARQAQEQQRLSVARELAAAVLVQLSSDPELAVLLALEAAETTFSVDGTVLPEAEDALHRAVQADRIQLDFQTSSGAVAFSQDGRLLALTTQERFRLELRDAVTGALVHELAGEHIDDVTDIAFSPNGRFLASADAGTLVKLWEVSNGQEIATFLGHHGPVLDLAFSPDNARLATASQDGLIRIWALADNLIDGDRPHQLREPVLTIQPPVEPTGVAFNPDGSQIAAYIPGSGVFVWDANSADQLLKIPVTNNFIAGLDFSPDGVYLAGGFTQFEAAVWDAETGEVTLTLPVSSPITDVDFSHDGHRLATAGEDGTAIIWDLETGQKRLTLTGHSQRIQRVVFSSDDQQLATGSSDRNTKVWDVGQAGSRELLTLTAHNGVVHDAVYSPDGSRIATTGDDAQVRLWNTQTGEMLFNWPGQTLANFPAFSPDGEQLAAANADGDISIWDVSTGEEVLALRGEELTWIAIAFSPEGNTLAAGGPTGIIQVWNAATGEALNTFPNENKDPIMEVVYLPYDEIWSFDAGGWVHTWETDTGELGNNWLSLDAVIWDAEFSQDFQKFSMALWNETAAVYEFGFRYLLRGHRGNVTGVAFTPAGDRLATSGFDGMVRLWDMATGEQLLILTGHTLPVSGVDFSPDGRYLAAAGSDGTVRIYIMDVEELMEIARSRLTRDFTREECQRFLHLDACPE